MENIDKKLMFFQFNSVSLPKVTEKKIQDKEIVTWGTNNLYPNQLIEYYNTCSLLTRLIDTRVFNIVGNSINLVDESLKEQTEAYLKAINFNKLLKDIALDYQIFGGFSLNTIFSKDKKKINSIKHLKFHNIRSGVKVEDIVEKYYISSDWSKQKKEIKDYLATDILNLEKGGEILYAYDQTPSLEYYPAPFYQSSSSQIETLIKIAEFNLNVVDNGYFPSILINTPTPVSDEKNIEIQKRVADFSGAAKSGGAILMYYDNPDQKTEIQPFSVEDLPSKMTELKRQTSQDLFISAQIPEQLAFATPGSLGNSNEIITCHQLFINTIIRNQQKFILSIINPILEYNGLSQISIYNASPVTSDISLIINDLSVNEKRRLFNLEEIPNDDLSSKRSLAQMIGVNNIQGVLDILSNTTMSGEQKQVYLNILYNISKKKAEALVEASTPLPTQIIQTNQEKNK